MKRICRILSIGLGFTVLTILAISIALIINKANKSKMVYAKTINFSTNVGSFEMLIDNKLVLDDSLVEITPANCTFKPIFTIKKSTEDDEKVIVGNVYSFTTAGKYTLYCKIKSGKNYEVKDSITINVVANATSDTSMYICKLPLQTFYIDDIICLEDIADIYAPETAVISLAGSEYLSMQDGKVVAVKDGVGTLDIILTYKNISIMETISVIIKPKVEDTGIELILSLYGNVIDTHNLEIEYSPNTILIGYSLTNMEHNQNINCWTDSESLSILAYDAPFIIIRPISRGRSTIYVSPINFPEIVFEINVTII